MPSLYPVLDAGTMDPFTHVSEKRSLSLLTHPDAQRMRDSTVGGTLSLTQFMSYRGSYSQT